MKAHTAWKPRAQLGLGLIEVMIALTIGLVLLLGVSQYFVSMRQTATSVQKLSALQNQQRMALYFLHVAVAGAGNTPNPANKSTETLYPSNATFPTPGQSLIGSVVSGTTKLLVRFVVPSGGGSQQGCSDNLVNDNVYTDEFSVTSDGYLQCVETNETTPTATPTTVKLIGDPVNKVVGMTVRYGVDTVTLPSQSIVPLTVTQYLYANQMTTALWPYVMSVEVTLQFSNPMDGQFGATSTVPLMETIPYMNRI